MFEFILALLAIVFVPLLLLYFFSNYTWRFKKLTSQELTRKKVADFKMWRLFGAFVMLASIGASINIFSNVSPFLSSMPLYVRSLIFLFGIAIVFASNYEEKKLNNH